MNKRTDDVLIIGGGLQGCSIGLFLARSGWKVTLIDKGLPGRHASGVNAGGLRLLMRDVREYPLSIRAMEMWKDLGSIVGHEQALACEVQVGSSQIALALDDAEMKWVRDRHQKMMRRGYTSEEFIDAHELHQMLPGLADSALGGLISRGDGHANPASASQAFRRAAETAGVVIHERCAVKALDQYSSGRWAARTERGLIEANWVINCAGAWGSQVAASLGDELPMRVLALSMMVTARVKPFIEPVVIGIDRPLSFKQSAVGSLVIGGGISGKPCLDDGTSFTVMDRMASSAAATLEAFPVLAGVPVLRTWTGLEGATPDGVPYIGPSATHKGLWHVFGFCGHGFQLAPAVGETVAHSLISGSVHPLIEPFSTTRFTSSPSAQLQGQKQ